MRQSLHLSLLLCILLLAFSLQQNANASDKLSAILRKKLSLPTNSDAKLDVVVYLKSGVNLAAYSNSFFENSDSKAKQIVQDLMQESSITSEEVINVVKRQNENLYVEPLWIANAVVIHGCTKTLLQKLAALPSVQRIVSDAPFKGVRPAPRTQQETLRKQHMSSTNEVEWNVEFTGAKKVWDMGYKGQGIVVGIADTGIDFSHPALLPRYRGLRDPVTLQVDHNYHWYDGVRHPVNPRIGKCGINATAPCDDDGHGTHCTGIIVGTSPDRTRQFGTAPNATFVGCRNMDQGNGRPSTYLNCFQFLMAPTMLNGSHPRPELRPHIVSNSYGCTTYFDECEVNTLKEAVEAMTAAGILMVAAGGNSGPRCSTIDASPGIYEAAFTVGATDYQTTEIVGFSARGPIKADGSNRMKPDISAPGKDIYSTQPDGKYGLDSGTSMACPAVAACAALLWNAVPSLQRDLAKTIAIIEQTALPMPVTDACGSSGVPNNVYGYGVIRIDEAVRTALKLQRPE